MYIFEYNPPIEIHNELNPVLWDDGQIRREIHVKLLQIAKEFYEFLGVSTPIEDVLITGSQANYNYTDQSDVDLHLVVDFNNVNCEGEVRELFDSKRKLWKLQHDIDIKNIPVECYVEDVNHPAVTASYSLVKDTWIKKPKEINVNYDKAAVEKIATTWDSIISHAVKSQDLAQCIRVRELLAKFRRASLDKTGEFGEGNLAFKMLRNSGNIKDLIDTIHNLKDRKLSLK